MTNANDLSFGITSIGKPAVDKSESGFLSLNGGLKSADRFSAWLRSQPLCVEISNRGGCPPLLSSSCFQGNQLPKAWSFGDSAAKVLAWQIDNSVDPNTATVIGGICSLFTGDRARIIGGELNFTSAAQFAEWVESWYPRLDQIHDAVGVPPKAVKRVIYVCEDSIWGQRVYRDTGGNISAQDASDILRSVHERNGAPLISKWLKLNGYQGKIDVVYSSQVQAELNAFLTYWERSMGRGIKPCDEDYAKVHLMYTGFWPAVLGVKDQVVIYEPAHHFSELTKIKGTKEWFTTNPYSSKTGLNSGVSAIGFLPCATESDVTRLLPNDKVPNIGNWKGFEISPRDAFAYGVNLFPRWLLGREDTVPESELMRRVRDSLVELFGE